ncbi:MAG: hypothetical protein JO041_00590 [Acidobacteria bacterium]|nr:hypothetical protein [Acidobacteriota bacterium]
MEKSSGSQGCPRCHSDHNGLNFQMIKWEPSQEKFDHSKTGWSLTGKHAELSCNRCHAPDKIAAGDKALIKMKDLNRSFLGLREQCVSCHADVHGGRLGHSCEQCHNTTDWKQVPNFDHSRTRYPLTGAHERVTCEKCHAPSQPGGAMRWTGLVFDRCEACHADPHHGSFASPCASCHNTASWKSVQTSVVASRFDHSKTKYPLLGKHITVACEQCHKSGDFRKPLAFQKCSDCHADAHNGQFMHRPDKGECSSCHTVQGWKPSSFGLKEHLATGYPLEGRHAAVKCEGCHIPKGKETRYKIAFAKCTDCHADGHQGQFALAPLGNRCDECHTLRGWKPSTFTVARHQTSRFPLVSSHVAVACDECHKSQGPAVKGTSSAQYVFKEMTCTACHEDPHKGQFRELMARTRADGRPAGCEVCHSVKSWKDLSLFNHDATKFPLIGSHRAVACIDCHRPPNLQTPLATAEFNQAPMTCEGCHNDVHGGQFTPAGAAAPECASCHNSSKWKPSTFNHDTRTSFPLKGLHKDVACARCHSDKRMVNGEQVLFYKPTPTKCEACHGPNPPKERKPA